MDFIFKTNVFLSNNSIDNILVRIQFKNCSNYDKDSLQFLKNQIFECSIDILTDNIYAKIPNKDFAIVITIENDDSGYVKEYNPENLSVIVDKDSNPKGIMINDTAEIFNINNLPANIKDRLSNILIGTPMSYQQNVTPTVNAPVGPPRTTSAVTPPPPPDGDQSPPSDRSSLKMSPEFNEIYNTTLKQMDNIKPSDDLLNEVNHIGNSNWVEIKEKLSNLGGLDASST